MIGEGWMRGKAGARPYGSPNLGGLLPRREHGESTPTEKQFQG
jgi:hypothetical protein